MGRTIKAPSVCLILIGLWGAAPLSGKPPGIKKKILNWVEVFPQDHHQEHLPVQIIFDFHKEANLQNIDKKIIEESSQLKLYLPAISVEEFEKSGIKSKLSAISYIKKVNLALEKNNNEQRSVLTLTFFQENEQAKNASAPQHGFIVRLSTMNKSCYNARRIILELYPWHLLHKLCQNHRGLRSASHQSKPLIRDDKYLSLTQEDLYKPLINKRIIIDAGHGGDEPGSSGLYNLVEKNLTLDIAQRIQPLLEQWGARVVLTRSSDVTVPLVKRSELAHQLQGDALVSIHTNVAGNEQSHGFETYSFDASIYNTANVIPSPSGSGDPGNCSSFYFVKHQEDPFLLNTLDACITHHNQQAKKLAHAINKSMVKTLPQPFSRGVKQEGYCLLLQSQMPTTPDFRHYVPTTLVEVGFTTNKTDAENLSSNHYRQLLAYAISTGIKDFFTQRNDIYATTTTRTYTA